MFLIDIFLIKECVLVLLSILRFKARVSFKVFLGAGGSQHCAPLRQLFFRFLSFLLVLIFERVLLILLLTFRWFTV